jgi:hypothetical protein
MHTYVSATHLVTPDVSIYILRGLGYNRCLSRDSAKYHFLTPTNSCLKVPRLHIRYARTVSFNLVDTVLICSLSHFAYNLLRSRHVDMKKMRMFLPCTSTTTSTTRLPVVLVTSNNAITSGSPVLVPKLPDPTLYS